MRWGEGHAGVQVPERARKAGHLQGPWHIPACGKLRYGPAWTCLSGASCPCRIMPLADFRRPWMYPAPKPARLSWPVPGSRDAGCVREGKEKG